METQRARQRAATRRLLLDSAYSVFSRQGLLATRSADIAAEAGVAHGTVFLHFPTMEELQSAVIEDFGDRLAYRLHELLESGCGVSVVLGAHLRAIGEYEDFYARLVVESPLLPEAARHSLVLVQSALSFHLGRALEAERAAGRIKPVPVHMLFNSWVGLVHHYLANRELFAPGGSVIERQAGDLLTHFITLIEKETGHER